MMTPLAFREAQRNVEKCLYFSQNDHSEPTEISTLPTLSPDPTTPPSISPPFLLQTKALIFHLPSLSLLASLCSSLEWLAEKLHGLVEHYRKKQRGKKSSQQKVEKIGGRTKVKINQVGAFFTISKKAGQMYSNAGGGSESGVEGVLKNLSIVLVLLLGFSQRCLMTLSVQYRIHCFYFLNNIQNKSYWLGSSGSEPDPFIHDLIKHIETNKQALHHHLPSNKMRYVFGTLSGVISSILIWSLQHKIQKINKFGVLKMCRNVFVLKQALQLLSVTQHNSSKDEDRICNEEGDQKEYERVQKYYELLNLDEDEMVANISDRISNGSLSEFTLEEYKAVFTKKKIQLLSNLSANNSNKEKYLDNLLMLIENHLNKVAGCEMEENSSPE